MSKRQLIGKVISDKMQKTVVVKVESIKEHPKYKQRYKVNPFRNRSAGPQIVLTSVKALFQ